jgi:hypothetical protein
MLLRADVTVVSLLFSSLLNVLTLYCCGYDDTS